MRMHRQQCSDDRTLDRAPVAFCHANVDHTRDAFVETTTRGREESCSEELA